MKRRLFVVVCIIGLFIGLVLIQKDLLRQTGTSWQQESMAYLPGNGRIKRVLLGFETTLAHVLWIRTILYFGGHLMTDRQYPWLINMLDIITRLCPWFYPAYEFGGLMIPDICNNPEAARILLERGMTFIGDRKWNLAFYLGMIYFKYYDDRQTAAHYIARASFVKGAPREKLISMAQAFFTQAGSDTEALRFLIFTYNTSENPDVRRFLAGKIKELQKGH